VIGIGSKLRLFSHMSEANILLDVAASDAADLIRKAIGRATLELTDKAGPAAREQITTSFIERENLCSTALHPEVALPHPRDPEQCPFADDRIVIFRASHPVEFHEIHGYRPRIAFLLLARTASLQLLWQARLSYLLHRGGFVERLLGAKSPGELYAVFAPGPQSVGDPQAPALATG
jgi:mannitol/fructose-specific phosphotransferase system IIA component (Ntr-type)